MSLRNLVFVCLLLALPAQAQETLVGSWTGLVSQPGRPRTPVLVTINSLTRNTIVGILRYDEPRACSVKLTFVDASSELSEADFNISGSNGGFCDVINFGVLRLSLSSDRTSATANISDNNLQPVESIGGMIRAAPSN
jgi:hypothetical protein